MKQGRPICILLFLPMLLAAKIGSAQMKKDTLFFNNGEDLQSAGNNINSGSINPG